MDIDAILAWGLPSIGLLLWGVLLAVALPRALRHVIAPGPVFAWAMVGLVIGLLVVGLWLWAVAAPLPPEARDFVVNKLDPWFWGTVTLVVFVVGALLVVRRLLTFLARKSEGTSSSIDDVMVAAIRRPAHVLVVLAGLFLWVELVPAPLAITGRIDTVGEVAIIVVALLFLDGLVVEVIARRRQSSRLFATAGTVLRATARVVLFIVSALMVLSTIGIEVTPIIASLGVGSLAVGLALQGTLEDFIAGLLIASDQPIAIGDFVQLGEGGLSGTVEGIGWRTTRILTLEQSKVIVPNSAFARATLINRSRPSLPVRFQASVGVHYDSDLNRVARVVQQAAVDIQATHEYATRDFLPVVTFVAFSASSIDLTVWLEATDWPGHYRVHDAFIRLLHQRFRDHDIVIPFPITTLDLPPEVRQAITHLGASQSKVDAPAPAHRQEPVPR